MGSGPLELYSAMRKVQRLGYTHFFYEVSVAGCHSFKKTHREYAHCLGAVACRLCRLHGTVRSTGLRSVGVNRTRGRCLTLACDRVVCDRCDRRLARTADVSHRITKHLTGSPSLGFRVLSSGQTHGASGSVDEPFCPYKCPVAVRVGTACVEGCPVGLLTVRHPDLTCRGRLCERA